MEILSLSWAVVTILMLGYIVKNALNTSAGSSPFLAICLITISMMICGMLNILWYGRIFLYSITLILFLILLHKNKIKDFIMNYLLVPGCIAFCVGSVFVIISYYIQQPFYTAWDEYSHWGPFYKNVFERNQLHYFYDNNLVHPAYPQGMTVFYYFISMFMDEFREADTFIAVNMVLIACVTTIFSKITWKNKLLAVVGIFIAPIFLLLFPYASPYVNPYFSIYLDTLMGAVFGAALITVVTTTKISIRSACVVSLAVLFMVQVKEIALILSLIVVVANLLMTFELKSKEAIENKIIILYNLIPVASVFLFSVVWKFYLSIMGANNDQFSDIHLLDFVYMLFGQDEKLLAIWSNLKNALIHWPILYNEKISILGCWIIFSLVGILLFIWLKQRCKKWGTAWIVIGMPVFCLAYTGSLFYVYTCNMSLGEALACASLQRYMSTFYIAWAILLIGCILNEVDQTLDKNRFATAVILTILISVSSLLITNPLVFPYNREMTGRTSLDEVTINFKEYFGERSRVWVIAQGEDGEENGLLYTYQLHYTFLPTYICLGLPWNLNEEYDLDTNEFELISQEKNITHILVYNGNNDFVEKLSEEVFKSLQLLSEVNGSALYKVLT